MFPRSFPQKFAALFALALVAPLSAAQEPAPAAASEYQTLNRILDEIERKGYTRIEEIDRELFGRFEVEAVDARSLEHKLVFDSEGKLTGERAKGGTDADDAFELATARRVVAMLQQRGYRDIEQMSSDDGFIEVEARDAGGGRVDVTLDPATLQVLATESDSYFDDFID